MSVLFTLVAGPLLPQREEIALGDHFEVCTIGGIVAIGFDGQPLPEHSGPNADHCIFCLPLMHGAADIPATAESPPPATAILAVAVAISDRAVEPPVRPAGAGSPRSPPTA